MGHRNAKPRSRVTCRGVDERTSPIKVRAIQIIGLVWAGSVGLVAGSVAMGCWIGIAGLIGMVGWLVGTWLGWDELNWAGLGWAGVVGISIIGCHVYDMGNCPNRG